LIDISSFIENIDSNNNDDYVSNIETKKGAQSKCVDEVLSACAGNGFFKIKCHGVPEKIIDDFMSASRGFFHQKMEIKLKATDPSDGMHGYFAKENLSAALGREGEADIREGYAIGPSSDDCDFFDNFWPSSDNNNNSPSKFEMAAKEYYDQMELLEKVLHIILTRALKKVSDQTDLKDDWLQQSIRPHRGLLRSNYYPTATTGSIAAHSDWSTLTVLLPTGPGLEVIQDEEWRYVEYDEDKDKYCFVVNVGDILERWSNGEFKSSIHRVKLSSADIDTSDTATQSKAVERLSFAYFAAEVVDPKDRSVVKPIMKAGSKRVYDEDLSIYGYMTRNFESMKGK